MSRTNVVRKSDHDSFSAERKAVPFPCVLLIVVCCLSGCGIHRETPTSQTIITPADIHQDENSRTIDLSYRVAGIDETRLRQAKDLYLSTITRELEDCGYIVKMTPWASQIGNHAKLQMVLEYDANFGMMVLSYLTFGIIPEIHDDLTTITAHAYAGDVAEVYEERVLVKTARWYPLINCILPAEIDIITESRAGMSEAIRLLVRRMREDRVLASPDPPDP